MEKVNQTIELFKPDWHEGIGLALCLLGFVWGIVLIRGNRHRARSWDCGRSVQSRRADLARMQKDREELPPGRY